MEGGSPEKHREEEEEEEFRILSPALFHHHRRATSKGRQFRQHLLHAITYPQQVKLISPRPPFTSSDSGGGPVIT